MRSLLTIIILMHSMFCVTSPETFAADMMPAGETLAESADSIAVSSDLRLQDDGWFDLSGFLDEKYGFLPTVIPITEPAVGYGAAGALAFIDKPIGEARAGFARPNISLVGGLGTENGTWGTVAGDLRHWSDNRLQSLVGVVYASVNLDFYGIGEDPLLNGRSLRYNLQPTGGVLQGKYRVGDSRFWAGVSYAFATTQVSFDVAAEDPRLPDFRSDSNVGGLTPSLTYDSRDNIFTPLTGTYVEGRAGIFSSVMGADDDFQRVQMVLMQFIPVRPGLYLGLRADGAASFGSAPFYLQPFIMLRGVPMMRYQGETVAQAEMELRWQFWKRFSVVGFAGYGAAWNDFERIDNEQTVVTGGTGFRYELARKYGIHAGLDVAFGPDETAIYIQAGSAWARP